VTASTLESGTVDEFTRTMRVNALSCMLAVKHASAAMKEANSSRGKDFGGGSIILTASVAGVRSGAGPIDCTLSRFFDNVLLTNKRPPFE
jgi:NAD(P)-dependent dehydrogenase (short-subunit alcohol dehydrogenase family)